MKKHIAEDIERLQDNLSIFRKAGKWNCEQFGDLLGLSKQSVCNLEHKTVKMSKAQYIAIRSIFDYETDANEVLYMIVKIFMNARDISDETMAKARTFCNGLSKKEMNYPYIVSGLSAIIGKDILERLLFESSESWMDRIFRKSEEE